MKIIKWLLISVFFILVLAGAAAAFLIANFDANQYKQQITAAVKKQTGRDLSIDGDLKLSVYPELAIAMGKTSLSNAEGFAGDDFAKVDAVDVAVKLMPLLKKQVEINEIKLDGLKLNLHRKGDGSTNWDDLAGGEKQPTEEPKAPNEVVEEMLGNLSVAGVSLKNADINWLDDQGGQAIRLNPVNLKTGTFKPGSPLPVELDLTLQQQQPSMTLKVAGATTVTLGQNKQNPSFTLEQLALQTELNGDVIQGGQLQTVLKGNISGDSKQVAIPDLLVNSTLTGPLIPQGAIKSDIRGAVNVDLEKQFVDIAGLKLDSHITGNPLEGGQAQIALTSSKASYNMATQLLRADGLNINTKANGKVLAGGSADIQLGSNARFDLAKQLLQLPGLKLDATLQGGYIKEGTAKAAMTGNTTVDLDQTRVNIPDLDLNTQVNGGIIPGGALNQQASGQVDLNWGNKSGQIELASILVKLADLQLTGSQVQIQPLAEKPAVKGQFQTNAFNLKQLLKTLGVEPPVTAKADALGSLQATFQLDANTEKADLQHLKLKLDQSNITGSLGVENFAAPGIRPQLAIDSINVDDYLAPPSDQPAQKAGSGSGELFPLDTLRTLNIDGAISIGNMVINKLKLSKVKTGLKADKGLINIDPANASLYQGNYVGNITLDARQPVPTMKMHHELAGLRSEGLLFDLFNDKYISGDAKVVIDSTSKGNSIEELLANLNGNGSMNFSDGTIRDSRLAEKASLVVKAFEKEEMEGDKTVIKFTGLSGDWKTTNGVMNTQNLKLESPWFNIDGKGTADLANQQLDMKLRIGKRNSDSKDLFAPLHIHGSFDNLKFSLKLDELVKALAKEDLKKVEAEAKAKLAAEKERLRLQAEAKKKELADRLANEKAQKEAQLKAKLEAEKAKQLQKVEEKVGQEVTDKLKQSLGGEGGKDAAKDLEEKAKDKLKEGLKGLF